MSLTADVAVGAAERLERSAGAAAGLKVWRRLASNAAGAELRGRAILGGLRCAIAVSDSGAIQSLSMLWETVDTVDDALYRGIFATIQDLARAGLGGWAVSLAWSEVKRAKSARALYAYARCLDVAGDARAAAAFGEALAQAEKEGDRARVRRCRVRRAAWLSRSAETLGEAIEEAKRVTASEVTPAERLVLARVLLRSPSRFARAGALGLLDEIVTAGSGALTRRALVLAARHADDRNDDLTPLEVDRLLALFAREPVAKDMVRARDTVRAVDRLARAKERKSETELEAALDDAARLDPELAELHHRARDILRGRFEAVKGPSTTTSHPEWTALLDAVVALRDQAWPVAAHALRRLADSAERTRSPLPPHAWTVAQAALAGADTEVRAVAGRLVAAMIKTTSAAPPRGWLGLAQVLAACGMDELATFARRSATLAKEPGAAEALGLSLTRSGWQLALAGERSRAIERLREARALAERRAPAGGASKELPAAPSPPRDPGPNPST